MQVSRTDFREIPKKIVVSDFRTYTASRLISHIGDAVEMKASEAKSGKSGKVKYASEHYLRQSFAFRWSQLVMPTELNELMRHENIPTTMQFYVGQDARATAKRLRQAVANTLDNSTPEQAIQGDERAT